MLLYACVTHICVPLSLAATESATFPCQRSDYKVPYNYFSLRALMLRRGSGPPSASDHSTPHRAALHPGPTRSMGHNLDVCLLQLCTGMNGNGIPHGRKGPFFFRRDGSGITCSALSDMLLIPSLLPCPQSVFGGQGGPLNPLNCLRMTVRRGELSTLNTRMGMERKNDKNVWPKVK